MKTRKVYEYEGKPVEFCAVDGKVYVFYSDLALLGSKDSGNLVPQYSISNLRKYFGEDAVLAYKGERGPRKYNVLYKETPLVLVANVHAMVLDRWKNRPSSKDLAAFLELAEEDMRKTVILRTPKPSQMPLPSPQKVDPPRIGVQENLSEAHRKLDIIMKLINEGRLVAQPPPQKRSFFSRIFSRFSTRQA